MAKTLRSIPAGSCPKRSTRQKSGSDLTTYPPQKSPNGNHVVTFTAANGDVYEIPDLPENIGRATALAAENNLRKIWETEQEAQECQDIFAEKSS